ncbi:MAG: M50 family metallopeptidase [Bacilli bacterium]|nr:M50 family metallopeptidase [Bacilli bacterium]
MSDFFMTVLDIVVFIISLGILIIIHELGHLTTAKIFKVYCYEFSIGMGNALYTHKPDPKKGQETAFSIRAFPIGGYVSMAGEDLEDAEGVDKSIVVPHERTIEGISRWKRVIIMFAGVFMNFVLAYILFFINYAAVPQTVAYYSSNEVFVVEDSKASLAGLNNYDAIESIQQDFYYRRADGQYNAQPDETTGLQEVTCYAYETDPENLLDYNKSISSLLSGNLYYVNSENKVDVVNYLPKTEGDKRVITLNYESQDSSDVKTATIETLGEKDGNDLVWGKIGIGTTYDIVHYSFGESFKLAWNQWLTGCSAIFVALAKMFTPTGFSQLGGIVAVFSVSSTAVSIGINAVLYLWGMISVNLAIFNLLPFPGLDGWQILVTIIEGIAFRIKKIKNKNKYNNLTPEEKKAIVAEDELKEAKNKMKYNKIKNIVSYVGLILLIVLAVVLVIKDIINL